VWGTNEVGYHFSDVNKNETKWLYKVPKQQLIPTNNKRQLMNVTTGTTSIYHQHPKKNIITTTSSINDRNILAPSFEHIYHGR
jgi:hypothetical protein